MKILPSANQMVFAAVGTVIIIGSCIAFGAAPGLAYLAGSYVVGSIGLYKDYKHGHDISPRNFAFWFWTASPVVAPFALYGMVRDAWSRHKRKNGNGTAANAKEYTDHTK